ncbi:hypothetical protein [Chondromyces apiculatus]|uniref:Putative cell-wall-anchored protein SasA (LPXTG motif) n=1 Tax=Chondromyces apiculatus DSM 436 TaxID=1192034 RepID=A0A017T2E0_9BACT|nr:hypothetical protein [Chondromyces apiculatus]EYF03137.1 putative cell-wall-anchored protein SasA (LPXTG motif) [Chondromyces apiculatus DSM 436]
MAGEGKHALLEVPDFGGGKSSYLRLGAAAPLGTSPGDDLAARITTFIDDDRKRDGCPEFVPVGERKAETAKLHTKGGWRDHCDGNRITTTKGDKVEVIGGNYKMLVLGRGDHESGWDISGGHVTEVTQTFAGGTTIEWVQNYGGTWKVVETTVKGEVMSTYHGDVVDYFYGNRKESYTGSEAAGVVSWKEDVLDDSKPHDTQTIPKINPKILDRTWATKIESYTGSEALRLPLIHEETWAEVMETKVDAKSMSDDTTVEGESRSTMKARTITSETTADAMKDTTTVTGNIESTTRADKMISTTYGDSEDATYGDTKSYHEGNSMATVLGIETTVNIGMVNEVVLGMMNDATIGATAEVQLGATMNLNVGLTAEITLAAKLEFNAVSTVEIGMTKTDVALDETNVALSRKVLSAMNLYF